MLSIAVEWQPPDETTEPTARTDSAAFDRVLRFEAIDDVRELGDVPIAGAGCLRPGVALRALNLLAATAADRERLRQAWRRPRVRSARRAGDRSRGRSPPERAWHRPGTHADLQRRRRLERGADRAAQAVWSGFSQDYFLIMLREAAPSIRRMVETIAAASGSLLLRCAGGKDRTGVVAAVLLLPAGVALGPISEDHALTAVYLPGAWGGSSSARRAWDWIAPGCWRRSARSPRRCWARWIGCSTPAVRSTAG
ncbi:MAG TPA: tyrosine-protein phosphatase [Dehalococcoidia bacterium]|nr:tyrosine-protein phosphatase [Dehalococcoidia bacterium]